MSTTIILSTGNSYTVDNDKGALVQLAVTQGKDHISLNGNLIKTSAIMEIRQTNDPTGNEKLALPDPNAPSGLARRELFKKDGYV